VESEEKRIELSVILEVEERRKNPGAPSIESVLVEVMGMLSAEERAVLNSGSPELLSKIGSTVSTQKGRRDHYLPQGYLRGFIDPAREDVPQSLWALDIRFNKWSEKSTKQLGHINGFYDYAGTAPELESLPSADETFLELENRFPAVREKLLLLRSKAFCNWTKHLPFLLRYMDMLRARSPLYFAQKEVEGKNTPTWTVDKVEGKKITLKSMEPSPPSDVFIKNLTLSHMREEIQKNGAWLWDLNWALRYTESVAEPFVTSEAPFVFEGPVGVSAVDALQHSETTFYFPVCWQVCLFGRRPRFACGTDKLDSQDLRVMRRKYRLFAEKFLISPTKLDDITDFEGHIGS
jgi:hypothetical protein